MISSPTLSLQDARKNLSDVIGRAFFANENTIITRSGKNVAVVISYNDYERYRQLEDQLDGELATSRLNDGEELYSSEHVKASLGL